MHKKKVFHIVPSLGIGGVETAVLSSIDKLNSTFDYKVLVVNNPNNVTINNVVSFNKIFRLWEILLYLKREKPDFIISSLWKSVLVGLVYKLIFKDKSYWVIFRHNTEFKHFVDKVIYLVSYNFCDIVFCDSNSTADKVSLLNENVKTKVVSFLIHDVSKKEPDFNQRVLKFVYIGRINKQKGILKTLNFLNEFKKVYDKKFLFDIYGKDENFLSEVLDLGERLELSENIEYKGELSFNEVPKTLLGYHVFIQFSDYEGMAMSVAEAMQVGLIIVVKPVGEIINYSVHNFSALHFDSFENLEKLKYELLDVVSNKEKMIEISKNAKGSFKSKLTYSESIKQCLLNLITQ